jgi:excisionase family DNA binding protein
MEGRTDERPSEAVLLTVQDAAKRMGTTTNAIRRLQWQGEIGYVKLGKRHLVSVSDLDRWIARNLAHHGRT